MKRTLLLTIFTALLAVPTLAQKFGHIDSSALLASMPETTEIQGKIEQEALVYEQELQNMQASFQAKYEEYQQKVNTWPDAIRSSKEVELQNLQQGIQDFSVTAQQDLAKLEETLLTPMLDRAKEAIEAVGKENGFTYIFDTSTGVTVYNGGEDVMDLVKAKLGME
ncbi:OmpH family outer membrane protein [Sanyastnella coralliicola]|uniref:OmpH family outer membrane protein n=1 Tax=Sanyastnella coralliicola TaxID=3069118 RepID=UPI0027BAC2A2|nr:OmpH family outer membrane protein [Longitalea sp. SCSIO 12813]